MGRQFTGAKTKKEFEKKDKKLGINKGQFSRDKKTGKKTFLKDKKKVTKFDPIELTKKGKKVEGGKITKKEIIKDKEGNAKLKTTSPTVELKKEKKGRIEMVKDLGKAIIDPSSQQGFSEPLTEEQKKSIDESNIAGLGLASSFTGLGGAIKSFAGKLGTRTAIKSGFKQQARAIPGKIEKATGRNANLLNTFKTNTKTTGLSKSMAGKVGFTIPAASALIGIIGSYPFAGFVKEEALQTLSFAITSAKESGDIEGQETAIQEIEELLNPTAWNKLLATIPYANVVKQLQNFYEAAAKKLEVDKKSLEKQRAIQGGEIESDFARERREGDEAAFTRQDEQAAKETERFGEIEEERTQAANEEKRLNSVYFQLLREKKFEEAEEFRITNFPT